MDVALKQQLKDAIQTIYMQMKEQAAVLSQSAAKMKDVDKKIDALKAKEVSFLLFIFFFLNTILGR